MPGIHFVSETASTASWDPHEALWAINLILYASGCSIYLLAELISSLTRVLHSGLFWKLIASLISPWWGILNHIGFLFNSTHFMNHHFHLLVRGDIGKKARKLKKGRSSFEIWPLPLLTLGVHEPILQLIAGS
jgi:hypothetical protein